MTITDNNLIDLNQVICSKCSKVLCTNFTPQGNGYKFLCPCCKEWFSWDEKKETKLMDKRDFRLNNIIEDRIFFELIQYLEKLPDQYRNLIANKIIKVIEPVIQYRLKLELNKYGFKL